MSKKVRRTSRSLQQFYKLLAGADDDKGGNPVVRAVGTVTVLLVLGLLALQTLAGGLMNALGLPQIPIGWLMGAFIVVSTIWVGVATWRRRRPGGDKD